MPEIVNEAVVLVGTNTAEWWDNLKAGRPAPRRLFKRSPHCIGCGSFPYAMCGVCHDYNMQGDGTGEGWPVP